MAPGPRSPGPPPRRAPSSRTFRRRRSSPPRPRDRVGRRRAWCAESRRSCTRWRYERVDRLHPGREGRIQAGRGRCRGRGGGARAHRGLSVHIPTGGAPEKATGQVIRTARAAATGAALHTPFRGAEIGHRARLAPRAARSAGVAPVEDEPVVRVASVLAGHVRESPSSTSRTFRPGASPVRFETRKRCVSTAIVSSPERGVEHHVRGLAADPGEGFQRLAGVHGTSPPWRSTSISPGPDEVARLAVKEPDGADPLPHPLLPERGHRARGSAPPRRGPGVAALTLRSVAWADRITATSSSKGLA